MKFTVVCPIHNEEECLLLSLPSIRRLDPDETIFILDRCTDNSEKLVDRYFPHAIKFSDLKPPPNWVYHVGWLRRFGYSKASNDTVLSSSADLVLDPSIPRIIQENLRGDCRLISIGYVDYPLNIQTFLKKIVVAVFPSRGFGGPLAFSREAWLETEDQESASKAYAEDTHLKLSIEKRYRSKHVSTRSIHLRPVENFERHFRKGQEYWRTLHVRSQSRIILQSVLMLRPGLWTGWRYERGKSHA